MINFLLFLFIIVVGVGIWLLGLPGKFTVQRSLIIKKPVTKVFSMAIDFKKWMAWQPWRYFEPDVPTEVAGSGMDVGDSYSWKSDFLGEGILKHVSIEKNKSVEQDMQFFKPFKSKMKIFWNFEDLGKDGVKVTWGSSSRLPIFLRPFLKQFKSAIGMDYSRGLSMLKSLAEKGKIASKVEIEENSSLPKFAYLGYRRDTKIKDLPLTMSEDFPALHKLVSKKKLKASKKMMPLSMYHKTNIVTGDVSYTAALPLEMASLKQAKAVAAEAGTAFVADVVEETPKAFMIRHIGSYVHLDNAWAGLFMYQRYLKFKVIKNKPNFELYLTDASKTKPEKNITEIYTACM